MAADLPEKHEPVLVYWDTFHVTTPAEVCWACSDVDAGRWVPASQCPIAAPIAEREGHLSPTYTAREDDDDDD